MRFALGDYAGAETAWRRLVTNNPSSARTHSQLGSLYLCLEANAPFKIDSAEAHLRRAAELNREETGPLLHLGEAALIRRDLAAADRYFSQVLATYANSTEARFYTGYIALKRGNAERAQAEFNRATASTNSPPARGEAAGGVASASDAKHGTAPAGVAAEGDTKRGAAPLTLKSGRCDQLHALATAPAAAGGRMLERYRRLDSLLSTARSRLR
jgi:Tfp pilus assembly protein PilF